MLRKAKSLLSVSCIILALGIYVTAMPAPASADCPMLPEPRSFPSDTFLNNTIRSQMWITNGVCGRSLRRFIRHLLLHISRG